MLLLPTSWSELPSQAVPPFGSYPGEATCRLKTPNLLTACYTEHRPSSPKGRVIHVWPKQPCGLSSGHPHIDAELQHRGTRLLPHLQALLLLSPPMVTSPLTF